MEQNISIQEYQNIIQYLYQIKNTLNIFMPLLKFIHGNLMECQEKVLKMLFAPTFVNHYIVLDVSFSQHCSINNHISISKKLINTYIPYILNQWPRDLNTDFILGNFLFRSVKLKMMIQINTYILLRYWIHYLTVVWVKISFFLELI